MRKCKIRQYYEIITNFKIITFKIKMLGTQHNPQSKVVLQKYSVCWGGLCFYLDKKLKLIKLKITTVNTYISFI